MAEAQIVVPPGFSPSQPQLVPTQRVYSREDGSPVVVNKADVKRLVEDEGLYTIEPPTLTTGRRSQSAGDEGGASTGEAEKPPRAAPARPRPGKQPQPRGK